MQTLVFLSNSVVFSSNTLAARGGSQETKVLFSSSIIRLALGKPHSVRDSPVK